MRNLNRRSLLVATAAAAVPAALAHATEPDPVLSLYAERQRLYLEAKTADDDEDHDAQWNAIFDVERQIAATPATTLEGAHIKLRLITLYQNQYTDDLDDMLLVSAARDLERFTA